MKPPTHLMMVIQQVEMEVLKIIMMVGMVALEHKKKNSMF
jgi:hypothetical protein